MLAHPHYQEITSITINEGKPSFVTLYFKSATAEWIEWVDSFGRVERTEQKKL